jgi:hypothetical protein
MQRHRITAKSLGHSYTIELVRFLSDEQAVELMNKSIGKAKSIIPVDISELACDRELFLPSGAVVQRIEIGRTPA